MTSAATWIGVLICVGPVAADVVYSLDDGTSETSVIVVAGSEPRPTLWLNAFDAEPGGEVITTISVTWGRSEGGGSGVPVHAPTTVLLYEDDPSDDGDPRTSTLLVSQVLDNGAPPESIDTGVFLDVAIPPTAVSGTFFVAALYPDPGEGFPAPVDTTDPDWPGRSWVFSSAEDAVNVVNLGSPVNFGGLIENPPFNLPGNWLLRASGVPAHGDADGDGDVDLLDYGAYAACMTGPENGPPASGCATFDFDGDTDVDMADFAAFELAFHGP
ncbi:MAG: hypothetical protein ACE5E6_06955 [Phycisphaerae bacterium]